MALANGWLILIAASVVMLAIGLGLYLGLRRRPQHTGGDAAPIARAERLRELPSFQRALRHRVSALAGILALGVLSALIAGVVAARPMAAQTIQPINHSRDIMLCLDVSGSMTDVDAEVITVFEELLQGFKGERIGLTIFNSSAVQVFPLTDDYQFVKQHLANIRESFSYTDALPEHQVGTLNGAGASLIGDGLAACAMGFDHPADERSRSVIFATDNEINGASIVTLEEAAAYAKSKGVRVFSLNPVDGKDAAVSAQLAEAAIVTGGQAFALRNTTTVSDVISQVQEQEATALRGQAQVIWTDSPNLWIAALMIAVLAFLVFVWRVRL